MSGSNPGALMAGVLTAVVLAAGFIALRAPDGLPPDGPRAVGFDQLTVEVALPEGDPLTEPAGGERHLSARVWYPAVGSRGEVRAAAPIDGPLAGLVVWSHDSGGSASDHASVARALASRGFVVIAPDHAGVARHSRPSGKPVRWMSEAWTAQVAGEADPLVRAGQPLHRALASVLQADHGASVEAAMARVPGVPTAHILYGGHGLGGAAALHSCIADDRCAGLITLDGPPLFEVAGVGTGARAVLAPPVLEVPLLAVRSETLATDVEQVPVDTALRATVSRARGDAWLVTAEAERTAELTDVADDLRTVGAVRDVIQVFAERYGRANPGADVVGAIERWPALRLDQQREAE